MKKSIATRRWSDCSEGEVANQLAGNTPIAFKDNGMEISLDPSTPIQSLRIGIGPSNDLTVVFWVGDNQILAVPIAASWQDTTCSIYDITIPQAQRRSGSSSASG